MPQTIATNYSLQLKDAQSWYSGVHIAAHRYVSATALERALEALVTAGVLPSDVQTTPTDLIHSKVAELMPMDIKKVRLYRSSRNLIRLLHQGLNAMQLDSTEKTLTVEVLQPLDQRHHYGGVQAVQDAIDSCGLSPTTTNKNPTTKTATPPVHRVINIGSGLGGPARYIASTVLNSEVLAIELQHDLHSTAQMLTDRCRLNDQVTHMAGDFMEVERFLTKNNYDSIVSWLTVLHFTDRVRSFSACYNLLKPGGTMYVADLCAVGALSVKERKDLRNELYCPQLSSSDNLVRELESVGFRTLSVTLKTEEWSGMVAERVSDWERNKTATVKDLGEAGYEELLLFYTMVRDMFQNGNVGGTVICVTKPKGW